LGLPIQPHLTSLSQVHWRQVVRVDYQAYPQQTIDYKTVRVNHSQNTVIKYIHDHPWKCQLFPVDHSLVVHTSETAPMTPEPKHHPSQTSQTRCAEKNA